MIISSSGDEQERKALFNDQKRQDLVTSIGERFIELAKVCERPLSQSFPVGTI
ncbi:MAG: hypothetical protein ACI8Q1_002209 [Parvicella sp.]|jgi:hypothetical protein